MELALVGPFFFFMIMFILTIALDLYAQVLLDDSVRNAVRQVQNGAITSGGAFKTAVCNEFGFISNSCQNSLQYDVQGAATFAAITPATLNADGTLSSAANFSGIAATGNGAPVFVLAQVAFLVPFKFINIANGIVTQNGTPSLYSTNAVAMEF